MNFKLRRKKNISKIKLIELRINILDQTLPNILFSYLIIIIIFINSNVSHFCVSISFFPYLSFL